MRPFSFAATVLAVCALGCGVGGCSTPRTPTQGEPRPTARRFTTEPTTVPPTVASVFTPPFPPSWPFPAGAPAPRSARGMIATDAALASRAGAEVLEAGGNAVDAVVAAALALAVVYPTAGNVGGGGFAVARVRGASYALDFRETAPARATHDMYLGPDGKPTRDSREGWRAAGVPGSIAGLYEAWHRLGSGRKTWPELVAPAIDLADRGFVVDEEFARAVERARERLAKDPCSAALFLPGGAPPAVGSTWRDPDLAALLRRVAQLGPSGFYDGPVAAAIHAAMEKNGGILSAADLRAYRAEWRAPIQFEYRGRHVVGMPPPSSGGVTMAMIAHVLSAWDLKALGWHTAAQVHVTAEAMRRAFAPRNERLGDPSFVYNPLDELLSAAWASAQRASIAADRATPSAELAPARAPRPADGTHTTHLSVVDAEGNAVASTTTVNDWFGAAVCVPGLGFVLNDEMDDFATVPGTPNMYGLVQGEVNSIAPGKRMMSSMSPTIVLGGDGKVELVLGAAGGSTIITTVFEELSNVVDFGMNVADAVAAPRFHQQDFPDVLGLETHGFGDDVVRSLEAMGHATKPFDHIADAPAVGREGETWEGAAEPRRPGSLASGP